MENTTTDTPTFKSGYSDVNGLNMYYEIYSPTGQPSRIGKPLVLIHGGGSTIQTSFGRIIPLLAKHRQVIGVELQAHGRTSDRDTDLSFEQDADDVATLLKNLRIGKADFLGFSNGGTTALQVAIRYPDLVGSIIAASALCKRSGVPFQFWDFMKQARLENMPTPLKEAYKEVAPDPDGLQIMHDRDAKRMVDFKDIPDEQLQSIKAPTLILIGDQDVITPEHAIEMHKLIAHTRLAIIPGRHGEYIGEVTTLKPNYRDDNFVVPIIENFLEQQ
ncbi:alpha/beta fold hydrolase [Parapedobacter koreensis]|uniref:Pimeloyl-ACP methyl ester carboxylesterase n=1 Tax=Parapedobacter koreensis TaxID=332977 RepID=A0A1H7U356_9SPHI|nr:alpha/beta hydrolase [Parapedobacter koreensis]SEL91522.1 Pimeloyl-ACP methyl ester carboxylesterase [Parapedobacter koreensis]